MIRLVVVLMLLFAAAEAEAEGPRVTAAKFLQMSSADQIVYVDGVLDTLTALSAEKLIPKKYAACSRTMNYGELISGVNSYLYKGLGSETPGVKEAMSVVPVSIWVVRLYWEKCEGRER
jgi:hypothetical protein